MTWKSKLPLILIAIIVALYSVIWFKTTSDITDALNQQMSDKMWNITQSHRIQFAEATASGFPFTIGVKLHDVVEDTSSALIQHQAPVFVGYNMFTQELFMHYHGKSAIDTKPLKDKKEMMSDGEFRYSIHMPISLSDLSRNLHTPKNLDILSNIQNIKLKINNATLKDITEKKNIVENADINFALSVKHHRKYQTLDELLQDIPQNYDITLNISNECLKDSAQSISLSMIYGLYIPFDLKYNVNTTLYTGSKTFAISDILRDIQLKNWESSASNAVEDASSKVRFAANISEENIKCDFESGTNIKIKPGYSAQLDSRLKAVAGALPSTLGHLKSAIQQLDFAAINLDSKNDPISIAIKFNLNLVEKPLLLVMDAPHIGISFRDIGLDIKNSTNAHFDDTSGNVWTSNGVISIKQYMTLARYLIDNYFKLYHLPENGQFNNTFYLAVFKDFMHKIANDVNHAEAVLTLEYSLQSLDIIKSKIGKFTLPEITILYYSSLLKHINSMSKDSSDAMAKFKTMVPDYILQPEALDKIIVQSKE